MSLPVIEIAPAVSVPELAASETRYSQRLIADLGGPFLALVLGACAFVSMLAAFAISPFSGSLMHVSLEGMPFAEHVEWLSASLVYMLAFLVSCQVLGLLDILQQRNLVSQLARSSVAAGIALVATMTFFHVALFESIGRFIVLYAWMFTWGSTTVMFWIFWTLCSHMKPRIGMIGDPEFTGPASEFFSRHERPIELVPFMVWKATDDDHRFVKNEVQLVKQWIDKFGIDEVVYQSSAVEHMDQLILCGISEGIRFTSFTDYVEKYYARTVPAEIPQSWLFSSFFGKVRPIYEFNKRIFDVVISCIGLVLSAPLLAAVYCLMKVSDRGPFLYSQTRVGRFGKDFTIYKVRSMRIDSEVNGAQWASKNDPRVTLIGRIIRKTRLDEVPQFWNVLKGEMSFIGPRPERPEFVEQLKDQIPHYQFRHLLKPGLTGWAQVNYPYGASVEDAEEKLAYDLYYIKYTSLFLDLQILMKTVGAVTRGAR